MICLQRQSAPKTPARTWHEIDWITCKRNVDSLQVRIVKARKEGRHNRVKALQWLLTHSFSGKVLAIRRVTENKGKNTPGVDGETWNTPEAKWQAIRILTRRGYRSHPLRRVYIPKANGKQRPLGIPTMRDRAMQALHLLALDPIAETTGDRHSYGFRRQRSCADAMAQCHIVLSGKHGARWVLEGDIQGCFDQISHEWILRHIPLDKKVLRAWLKAGVMEQDTFHPTEEGTPQGGIISPVIANMVLDGLEKALEAVGVKRNTRGKIVSNPHKVNLIRYADDFLITGISRTVLEQVVQPLVATFLRERGLTLSSEKTRVTHIDQGFDFLGQQIRSYKGKVLITPAKKSVKAVLTKIRGIIRGHATAKAAYLIQHLNPILRGWVNYHRHICAKETFRRVDHAIQCALWRWATRRHHQKSVRWIWSRYFLSKDRRYGVFTDTINGRTVRLIRASEVAIIRHVKVRTDVNPYVSADRAYYRMRIERTMKGRLKGMHWRIWTRQHGRCPICHGMLSEERGRHLHHCDGDASNTVLTNLILLHPNCHRLVHNPVGRIQVASVTPDVRRA